MTRPARKALSPRERRLLQRYQQRIVRNVRVLALHPQLAGQFNAAAHINNTVEQAVRAILSEPFAAPRPKPRRTK